MSTETVIPRIDPAALTAPAAVKRLQSLAIMVGGVAAVLWVIAVLGNITVIHRMIFTYQETKRLEDAQLRGISQTQKAARA